MRAFIVFVLLGFAAASEHGVEKCDQEANGMAVMADSLLQVRQTRGQTADVDVVILGAGGSGLAAAHTLEKQGGISYIVLEAKSEIGGRMRSFDVGGNTFEQGANWIQGKTGSWLWDLAQRGGMAGRDQDWDSGFILGATPDVLGKNWSEGLAWNNSEAAFGCVRNVSKDLEAHNMTFEGTQYVENALDIRQALRYCGWNYPNLSPADQVIEWFEYDFEFGSEPGETSLMGGPVHVYNDYDDSDYFVTDARGWKPALEALEYDVSKIRFGARVTKIQNQQTGVQVFFTDAAGQSTVNGRYAINTFSVGVLQHNRDLFNPPLPLWKQFEVDKFEMATYVKIFIQFDRNFWISGWNWEYVCTVTNIRGYYPNFQNMDAPGFFNDTNTLLATLTGNFAKRAELMDDGEILAEALAVLQGAFGANMTGAAALEIKVGRWLTDPLYWGSYSNWPTGTSNTDFIRLQTAVGSVMFGGEATHPRYNGYVHGALEAGRHVANEAISCLQDEKSSECKCVFDVNCDTYEGAGETPP